MAVSLSKGQKISLKKEGGEGLRKVVLGLGWDVAKPKGLFGRFSTPPTVDLDASCVLFDARREAIDTVSFRQLQSKDGSIVHTGDNRTGAGDGDDEQITVDLERVPGEAASLVFTINSFTGQTFEKVANAYCRLVDATTNKEIARYTLGCQGSHTAQIMARVYRHDGEWKLHAIGENCDGRTIGDIIPLIQGLI